MPPIFHITHISNLRSIVRRGELVCDRQRRDEDIEIVNIAYGDLKAWRSQRQVPVPPHGTLADYVPLYFGPRSPMLYAINGGWVDGYDEGQTPILHLVTSSEAVGDAGSDYVYTDGHPRILLSRYYKDPQVLPDVVDLPLMRQTWWHDTDEDPDRKRRRQAEFLVHGSLAWEAIESVGVLSQDVAKMVEGIVGGGEHQPPIRVEPGWYY